MWFPSIVGVVLSVFGEVLRSSKASNTIRVRAHLFLSMQLPEKLSTSLGQLDSLHTTPIRKPKMKPANRLFFWFAVSTILEFSVYHKTGRNDQNRLT